MHWLPEIVTVVRVAGVAVCAIGIILCYRLWRSKPMDSSQQAGFDLAITGLSGLGVYKFIALAAFIGAPSISVGLANYHIFEGVKEVKSCAKCHVMRPMVNDMNDPKSTTLAARHARNGWIAKQQCYACHTDYGLAGTLKAKMDGYRHLARYTTGTYSEPIEFRGTYNNQNCLDCHEETVKFQGVTSHGTVLERLRTSSMSCLNCHGRAHPSALHRTPGHPEYKRLLKGRDR
jgi:cytochrome c nitrite reductase small subunit